MRLRESSSREREVPAAAGRRAGRNADGSRGTVAGQLGYSWYLLRRNPLSLIGLGIVLAVGLVALAAPVVAPHPPDAVALAERLLPPGPSHWFGTDEMGRDILSRVIWGARVSLSAGLIIVGIGAFFGIAIGSASGAIGGVTDTLIMRLMDVILAFPSLVLSMALAAALGPNLTNAMLAVAFVRIPVYVRLVRGQALEVREKDFVRASRASGASGTWTVVHHIIPNTLTPVLVQASLDIGGAILTASALSFLGLGAQPPTAEWGAMVSSGRRFILDQWWYATFPGAAILVTAIGFNLFGDGLRDILDPRLRR